ncbi:MAG: transposase [Acidobacteria bacterium]|nr:transposase [Acidobacteriota bacterium]
MRWSLSSAYRGTRACPLVLERLSLDEASGDILYRTRPSRAAHPEGEVARWDVYELIARVLDHLPPPRQQLVRYWGYYSNVSRGKRRAALPRNALSPPARPPTSALPPASPPPYLLETTSPSAVAPGSPGPPSSRRSTKLTPCCVPSAALK